MSLMSAQMGISISQGLTGFFVAKEEAKLQRVVQAYNNTISALSASQADNVTTLNEIQAQDASTRMSTEIQRQSIVATGQAKVAAGAAGVAGGSVKNVMRGLRSSAARAQYARTEQLQGQFRAFGQERRNTAVAKVLNKDISVIPQPSGAAALVGIGTNLLDIWDSHQAPGETIADRLSTGQSIAVRR